VVLSVDCELLVLSYNDESWLAVDELEALCAGQGREVATLTFDSARYVGARIGIFDPSGVKVGRVSHLSNHELLVIAGERALVRRVVDAVGRLRAEGAPPPVARPAAPTLRAQSRSASIGGVKAT
jgi:adenine-specific DNA-methyltransferase